MSKFKVGDKVRRIKEGNHCRDADGNLVTLPVGSEVVVLAVDVGMLTVTGFPAEYSCHEDYFELVVEPAPTARSTDPASSKGKRRVNKYEEAVLRYLIAHGTGTGKEIAAVEQEPLNCITPRFAPLRRRNLIKDTGVRKDKQIVWGLV